VSAGFLPPLVGCLRLTGYLFLPFGAQTLRRERVEIIQAILNSLAEGTNTKTRLMYKSNLDSRALKKYLAFMSEKGLLTEEKGSHVSYSLTEKGKDFLQRCKDMEGVIS
jgi:predicted transcriptional regulator